MIHQILINILTHAVVLLGIFGLIATLQVVPIKGKRALDEIIPQILWIDCLVVIVFSVEGILNVVVNRQ